MEEDPIQTRDVVRVRDVIMDKSVVTRNMLGSTIFERRWERVEIVRI